MPFNARLKILRNERGLTQNAFAEKLCVTLRAYQNYEQGIREPAYSILINMALILDTTLDDLLCIDEYRK